MEGVSACQIFIAETALAHEPVLKSPHPCVNLSFPMADHTATLLRELPSIDRLLKHSRCEALLARYNREYITAECRAALDQIRSEVRRGGAVAAPAFVP